MNINPNANNYHNIDPSIKNNGKESNRFKKRNILIFLKNRSV